MTDNLGGGTAMAVLPKGDGFEAGRLADFAKDYDKARLTQLNLLANGQEALTSLLDVAMQTGEPRHYEVLAQMIKTLSETGDALMGIHHRIEHGRAVKKVGNDLIPVQQIQNAVFVGSTTELQAALRPDRSMVHPDDVK